LTSLSSYVSLASHVVCVITEMEPVQRPDVAVVDIVSLNFADRVASLIKTKFSDLSKQLSELTARRKVLSGIVMTTDGDDSKDVVICVTTGTKCVNGEYMSEQGTSVNDCHAEVIALRCLRRFLFTQMLQYFRKEESIFTENIHCSALVLKPEKKFHLFISSAPCGDARVFSPHEVEATIIDEGISVGSDNHPKRQSRGVLRTKIESGEGTIPVQSSSTDGIQTFDGILVGERLLTMSCSDKLARINVLGVQGS